MTKKEAFNAQFKICTKRIKELDKEILILQEEKLFWLEEKRAIHHKSDSIYYHLYEEKNKISSKKG